MELGNELKVERTRLKVKAVVLSDLINVSKQQIYNLEQSDCMNISVIRYIMFLRKNGVDLNDLFDRTDNGNIEIL